jgi:ElaB/YqjD/DUF883 family membrane-anchored ribosome-binding protein/predicted small secreted protein
MKKALALAIVVAASALLVTGCPDGGTKTGSGKIDKLLDEMHYEKAKTLGDVAMKVEVAMMTNELETYWNLMSKEGQKSYDEKLKNAKERIDGYIKNLEERLNSEQDAESKKSLQEDLDQQKAEKERLSKLSTGKEYFKYDRTNTTEVIGEEFSDDGNTGWLKMKNTRTGEEFKGHRKFVKEDGKWKIKG